MKIQISNVIQESRVVNSNPKLAAILLTIQKIPEEEGVLALLDGVALLPEFPEAFPVPLPDDIPMFWAGVFLLAEGCANSSSLLQNGLSFIIILVHINIE